MATPIPKDVLFLGQDLVLVWNDGREDYIPLEKVRRACPCAFCKGEKDLFGNVYKGPDRPYLPTSFQMTAWRRVGGYALQIDWGDRHNDGLYSWESLRQLGEAVAK